MAVLTDNRLVVMALMLLMSSYHCNLGKQKTGCERTLLSHYVFSPSHNYYHHHRDFTADFGVDIESVVAARWGCEKNF